MTRKARCGLLALMLVLLVGCDQASKQYATRHLQFTRQQPLSYLNETFRITYDENKGAFLSLFANMPDSVRFWLLTVLNGGILVGVAYVLLSRPDWDRRTFFALGLLLAGGIGNLIDRIALGVVVDFMVIDLAGPTGIPWLRTGIFNVADMAITTGFLLLLPQLFQRESPSPKGAAA